jgi:hypothetical protein
VSYQTADQLEPVCTEIVPDSNDPVWCHENNCRLSKELLTTDNTVRVILNVSCVLETSQAIFFVSVVIAMKCLLMLGIVSLLLVYCRVVLLCGVITIK